MKKTCILSPDRQLTEEEQSLVWKKPPSHIESEAEKRIYEEIVRNWNRGEMKISTILLEGDAGSGKTQIAKALSADFNLPYTKVTCFAFKVYIGMDGHLLQLGAVCCIPVDHDWNTASCAKFIQGNSSLLCSF